MNTQNNEETKNIETKYAQLVSSALTQYDTCLIFHQVKPIPTEPGNIKKIQATTEEVVKVHIPHKTMKELSDLLLRQLQQMEQSHVQKKSIKQEKGNLKKK